MLIRVSGPGSEENHSSNTAVGGVYNYIRLLIHSFILLMTTNNNYTNDYY